MKDAITKFLTQIFELDLKENEEIENQKDLESCWKDHDEIINLLKTADNLESYPEYVANKTLEKLGRLVEESESDKEWVESDKISLIDLAFLHTYYPKIEICFNDEKLQKRWDNFCESNNLLILTHPTEEEIEEMKKRRDEIETYQKLKAIHQYDELIKTIKEIKNEP